MSNGVDFKAIAVELRSQLVTSEASCAELLEALEEIMDGYLYGCDMATKRENIKRAYEAMAKARGQS